MKVYLIGIGGIGVSALAQYYLESGYQVLGSDLQESEIVKFLKRKGARIYLQNNSGFLKDPKNEEVKIIPEEAIREVDLVVYSLAVDNSHPEYQAARQAGIPLQSYPEALGEITKNYFTIAISGTHGKSTTTSMVSLILARAGFDPTVFLGTKLEEFGNNNFRKGNSKYLVIEADEYKGAFLNYHPDIIALTSLEEEHLDYFKDLQNIFEVYKRYISSLPEQGVLIANKDDKNVYKLTSEIASNSEFSNKARIIYYSLNQQKDVEELRKRLRIPGVHNIQNALAALNAARCVEVPDKTSLLALGKYQGSWRRFQTFICERDHSADESNKSFICRKLDGIRRHSSGEQRLEDESFALVSDYAHHPTEIKATLAAAKEKFPQKRIICVFQPHQYYRTKVLLNDLAGSFDDADYLILNEIFEVSGRESKKDISSQDLAAEVKKRWQNFGFDKEVVYIKEKERIKEYLKDIIKPRDVVIIMGAGNIYTLVGEMATFIEG